jgi:putative oxidoreductase
MVTGAMVMMKAEKIFNQRLFFKRLEFDHLAVTYLSSTKSINMKRTLKTGFNQQHLDTWLLLLRILISAFMLTHGLPKFYKLIAGGEIQFREIFGMSATISLTLAVFAEVVCSTFVLIGLATRLSVIPLVVTMLVAAFVAHGNDPFGKKEVPLLYCFIYLTLLILGGGKYSIDYLLTRKLLSQK